MTISSTSNKASFNGSGTTGPFAFTFKTFTEADLEVISTDLSDVEATLVLTTDYTVGLNADQNNNPGGSVTTIVAMASGYKLTIVRTVDALQETDITNGGGFYPEVIENALDRATMLAQQNAEQISRAILVGVSSETSPAALLASINAAEVSASSSASSASSSATSASASAVAADADAASAANSAVAASAALGLRNRIINGDMRVAQRSSTTALNGGRQFGQIDRFTALLAGSAVSGTLTQDAAAGTNTSSGNALHLAGISYTAGYPMVGHRIESKDTASLNGKQITVSCKVYHDFGSSRNFAITLNKANAANDFSGVTPLGSGTNTPCASGAWTQVTYTVTLGAMDASNGLEIIVNDTATSTVAAKNAKFGDFQLELGSVVTAIEQRPYEQELALCQRHLPAFTAVGTTDDIAAGFTTTNNTGIIQMPFAVEPRIPPTGITTSAVGQFTITGINGATSVASALTFQRASKKVAGINFTGTANPYTTQMGCYMYANTGGAHLLFTGAEL
jgi:hypothetical protein